MSWFDNSVLLSLVSPTMGPLVSTTDCDSICQDIRAACCHEGKVSAANLLQHCIALSDDNNTAEPSENQYAVIINGGSRRKSYVQCLRMLQKSDNNNPLMVILRGLPGSGKSVLASLIALAFRTETEKSGYVYDPSQLSTAHGQAQMQAAKMMHVRSNLVVIDNTNCQEWEMVPYLRLAGKYGYCVAMVEPKTPWSSNLSLLASKNRHGVRRAKLQEMGSNFVSAINVQALINRVCDPSCRPAQLQTEVHDDLTNLTQSVERSQSQSEQRGELESSMVKFSKLMEMFPGSDLHALYANFVACDEQIETVLDSHIEKTDEACEPGPVVGLSVSRAAAESFVNLCTAENLTPDSDLIQLKFPAHLHRVLAAFIKCQLELPSRSQASFSSAVKLKTSTTSVGVGSSAAFTGDERKKLAISPQSSLNVRDLDMLDRSNRFAQQTGQNNDLVREDVNVLKEQLDQLLAARQRVVSKIDSVSQHRSDLGHFKPSVVGYYASEVSSLGTRIKELKSRIARLTFVQSSDILSDSLDLHGLTLAEAIDRLGWYLEAKTSQSNNNNSSSRHVHIITGWGSTGKMPAKIKPGVESFLIENDLQYQTSPTNPGAFKNLTSYRRSPEVTEAFALFPNNLLIEYKNIRTTANSLDTGVENPGAFASETTSIACILSPFC